MKILQSSTLERSIELEVSSTPIDAAYFKEVMPKKGVPESARSIVDDTKDLTGSIAIKRLWYSNTLIASSSVIETNTASPIENLTLSLELKDFGFKHERMMNAFGDFRGELLLERGSLVINNVSGEYGSSTLKNVHGEVRNITTSPELDIELGASLDSAEAFDEIDYALKEVELGTLYLDGGSRLSLEVTGSLGSVIKLDSSVDLTDTTIHKGNYLEKIRGHLLKLDSTVTLDESGLSSAEGKLTTGSSTVDLKASSVLDGKSNARSYSVEARSEAISIEDVLPLTPLLSHHSPAKGAITFDVKINDIGSTKTTAYLGEARIEQGLFKSPYLAKSVRDFNATLRLNGNTGTFVVEEFKVGDSDVSGKVTLTDISKGTTSFSFLSQNLNVLDVFDEDSGVSKVDKRDLGDKNTASAEHSPHFTGSGTLTIKKGTIGRISFDTFRTEVTLDKEKATLRPLVFYTNSGQVDGEMNIYRSRSAPLFFKTSLVVSRLDTRSLIGELGARREILTGRLTALIELESKRVKGPFTSGLDGDVRLTTVDGRLWKFVVLSKIFSIVNIISISDLLKDGLPYKTIYGDFKINDGVISTENMALDSDSLRISAIGKIDTTQKSIDATLALHPFVTMDKVVSSIPLAGWILIGEGGTINMYYDLDGPLGDMRVEPVPVKGLGKKALGILERLLTSPVKGVEVTGPAGGTEKRPDEEGVDK